MTATTLHVRAARAALLGTALAAMATTAAANPWHTPTTHAAPHTAHVSAPHVPSPAQTSVMTVDVNRTHVLRLGKPASAVVVGNPAIADIAVHSTDTILVLGRNYGTTNIIAFDGAGNVMAETTVTVGDAPSHARLRVYEGAGSRKTYECGGECLPVPMVGDDPAFRTLNTNSNIGPLMDTVVNSAATATVNEMASQGMGFGQDTGQPAPMSSAPPAPMSPPSMMPPGMGGFGGPPSASRPVN